jgi:hypothetical protein
MEILVNGLQLTNRTQRVTIEFPDTHDNVNSKRGKFKRESPKALIFGLLILFFYINNLTSNISSLYTTLLVCVTRIITQSDVSHLVEL